MTKCLTFILTLCAAVGLQSARAADRKLSTVQINGQDYVQFADWVRANDFKYHWLKRDDTVEASGSKGRAIFSADSCEATINGVQVWLCLPFAVVKSVPYLAQLDVDDTLGPLLSPDDYNDTKAIKTICLDPGHGGKDPGNRVGSREEKHYTLLLAVELRDLLAKAGFKVILTRTSDTYVDLSARPALANQRGADLFVSLHFNAVTSGRNEVTGSEVYCITPVGASSSNARGVGSNHGPTIGNRHEERSLWLAYEVQKSLVRNLNADDRGVRRARFAVLRDAKMPAILVEGGYMSNPVEGKKIFDPAYRRQMAEAIVKGILAYKNQMKPSSSAKSEDRAKSG